MKSDGFNDRFKASAADFVAGVQPALESRLKCKIYPVEDLQCSELIKRFDQNGVDAFRYDRNGQLRALASRMNYSDVVKQKPMFSFRYGLWNDTFKVFDLDREYFRKMHAGRHPERYTIFPTMHVESYCYERFTGKIGWSFAASTREIIEFAEENIDNEQIVRIFPPHKGEKRLVLTVSVDEFGKKHRVITVPCSTKH